jgi:hypothetical protein
MNAADSAALRLRRVSCGRGQDVEGAEAVIQETGRFAALLRALSGPDSLLRGS